MEDADLGFWCEWEPESEVLDRIDDPQEHWPRHIYRPYYVLPRTYDGLQNTDPFVFGSFFYGICQQFAAGRPTRLRHLAPGSVVLFGSHLAGEFVLDTVFVVQDGVDHQRRHDLAPDEARISPVYDDVVLKVLYPPVEATRQGCVAAEGRSYRLYFGATYSEPEGGMFSFFPCLPRTEAPRGFSRPVIRLPGLIKPRLRQKFTTTRAPASIEEAHAIWSSVVEQVTGQGLALGVAADVPECRSGPDAR
jgi:hypothetical protein